MKTIIFCILSTSLVLAMLLPAYAAPTTYRAVYREADRHSDRHRNTSPYKFGRHDRYEHSDHRYPAHLPAPYPQRPQMTRPQIAIVTPNIGVYVTPQPQYHYQKTEEVYLPYGGTYRKSTEYLPQTPSYRQVIVPRGVILKQGHYDYNPQDRNHQD